MVFVNAIKKIQFFLIISLYALINSLFVYKYGSRLDAISPIYLVLTYLILIAGLFFVFYRTTEIQVSNSKVVGVVYWCFIGLLSLVFTYVIFVIDGESLNVDRWAALEITVEGLLKREYPYTRLDYLDNMSSNFPALGFIGLPFYLLGDVGYLQVFTFIVFSFYLYKRVNIKIAFLIIGLFVISPAMLWEIAVKSDLVSNLFWVLMFIEWWVHRGQDNLFRFPITLAIFVSFFVLTRGIVVIPLVMFFLKDFLKSGFKEKWRFGLTMIFGVLLICLPTVLTAPDWDTLLNYNPVVLQTNKAPMFAYVFLICPFIIPFLIKRSFDYYFYVTLIIFIIPLVGIINSFMEYGWNLTFFEHKYDISYLSMAMPSLLVWLSAFVYKEWENFKLGEC